eukprot:358848-Chlamydomonas_euryale.AAC.7
MQTLGTGSRWRCRVRPRHNKSDSSRGGQHMQTLSTGSRWRCRVPTKGLGFRMYERAVRTAVPSSIDVSLMYTRPFKHMYTAISHNVHSH